MSNFRSDLLYHFERVLAADYHPFCLHKLPVLVSRHLELRGRYDECPPREFYSARVLDGASLLRY